jgi:hypothetical protein
MRAMSRGAVGCTVLLALALGLLGFAGTAAAKLTGPYVQFQQCPYTNPAVEKCLVAVTESGEVVLGSKKVPIVNPVTIQAGLGEVDTTTSFAPFFAPKNGITISKAPQPVPGGLAGLINCKEIKEPFVRFTCELALENGVTGVNSTLELARPVNEAQISQLHLAEGQGVAIKLPVKFHLENPLLGANCYVGSSSSPIIWELTDGKTAPPPPNESITGSPGHFTFPEEGLITETENTLLVDNAWSAPGATGCGGPLVELALDPVIDVASGLPAAAGKNTAILESDAAVTTTLALQLNEEENP